MDFGEFTPRRREPKKRPNYWLIILWAPVFVAFGYGCILLLLAMLFWWGTTPEACRREALNEHAWIPEQTAKYLFIRNTISSDWHGDKGGELYIYLECLPHDAANIIKDTEAWHRGPIPKSVQEALRNGMAEAHAPMHRARPSGLDHPNCLHRFSITSEETGTADQYFVIDPHFGRIWFHKKYR